MKKMKIMITIRNDMNLTLTSESLFSVGLHKVLIIIVMHLIIKGANTTGIIKIPEAEEAIIVT